MADNPYRTSTESAMMIVAGQMAAHIDALTGKDDRDAGQVSTELLQLYTECLKALMLIHSTEAKPAQPQVMIGTMDRSSRPKKPEPRS